VQMKLVAKLDLLRRLQAARSIARLSYWL
jgi:hypothetical protein